MLNYKTALVIPAALALSGCFATFDQVGDAVKAAEGRAYDAVAEAAEQYCEAKTADGIVGSIAEQEALELRREIRQRGGNGPAGPNVPPAGLDDKTAYGSGPVARIYCEGEEVPAEVWEDFVRTKP